MDAAGEYQDLASIAKYLGFAPQHIYYLVENPDRFYVRIEVPKRSKPSEVRKLDIPNTELKGVQRAINKNILSRVSVGDCVHSYVRGRSILTAAREFCPGRSVLKLDLADFFPSIKSRRVFGVFRALGFKQSAAFILTRLSTMNNQLAQGAPTSPVISNLVVREMDLRLLNLAFSWDINYIRYSDDLFFYKDRNFNHPRLAAIVEDIVDRSGFSLNRHKTIYHPRGRPRITLGLLTHGEKPAIPGPQRRRFRVLFFKASRNIHWAHENREHLRGVLEWYKSVYGKNETYDQYRTILDNVARLRLHDSYKSR
ncbi:MAG: reverse transcriptase domain-containing protein [Devosia sp.]